MIEIKDFIKKFKEEGRLNIVFLGDIGAGRSTLMLSLAKELSKELNLDFNLDNIYFSANDNKEKSINLYEHDYLYDLNLEKNINLLKLNPMSMYGKSIFARLCNLGYFEINVNYLYDEEKKIKKKGFYSQTYTKLNLGKFKPLNCKLYKDYTNKKNLFLEEGLLK